MLLDDDGDDDKGSMLFKMIFVELASAPKPLVVGPLPFVRPFD